MEAPFMAFEGLSGGKSAAPTPTTMPYPHKSRTGTGQPQQQPPSPSQQQRERAERGGWVSPPAATTNVMDHDSALMEPRSARSGGSSRAGAPPRPTASPSPPPGVTPLMLPRPPDSARPSTSAQHSKPQPSGSATPRPNTARDGSGSAATAAPPGSGTSRQPHPPPPGSKPNATAGAAGVPVAGAAVAAAAAPGTAGAPAVSHYAVGKTIGEGTFGKVKKGIHKLTGLPVAIKILEKERIQDLADVARVKREIHILTRVRHPNVIRLFEVIDSPRHIFLIMEFSSGGELFDYIVAQGRVEEDQACRFFHQILNGTDYFHNKNIIHRDLKPENLLLQKGGGGGGEGGGESQIKIVDFGLGNVAKPGRLLKTACGSPCYAAPEMIAGKRYVGPGADLWSLGVILFALVCGYLPFEDGNTSKLYEKIMQGAYEVPEFVSQGARDLIGKLLTTDPRRRYNAEQVRRHPWYARLCVDTDPVFPGEETDALVAAAPVVPGPAASGKRVRRTRGGHVIDEESSGSPSSPGAGPDAAVLAQMAALGYQIPLVLESIQSNRHDHFAATYHLLLVKREMTLAAGGNKGGKAAAPVPSHPQQQQPAQQPQQQQQAHARPPPPVPRIPASSVGGGGAGAPMLPSAPVSVHHAQQPYQPAPPASAKPSYLPAHQGQHQHQSQNQNQNRPASSFMHTQPLPSSAGGGAGGGAGAGAGAAGQHHPAPPSSARVQSAGTVRPAAASAAQSGSAASARPTTSYKAQHAAPMEPHSAWQQQDQQSAGLGVANGVNGGTGVNAYMQHYQAQQAQQAALLGQQQQQQPGYSYAAGASGGAAASAATSARPASSTSASARTPLPPKGGSGSARTGTIATPKSAAYVRASSGRAGRAGAAAVHFQQQQAAAAAAAAAASHDSNAAAGLAIGPATGRPMTSRITGSTGGVSHRLYLPPSERAAHELAAATAAAMAASGGMSGGSTRPSTGTGARPGSGYSYQQHRPGTSSQGQRASGGGINGVGSGARPPSAAVTLVGSSGPGAGTGAAAAGASAFGTQLSAMSFKSSRAILDELQRVLSANGLQWSVLPPSAGGGAAGAAAAAAAGHPASPLGPKHGFVPASIGAAAPVSSAGGSLAPISISSLRPQAHAADGVAAASSSSSAQVLECRQGGNRFQFHIAPLTTAAARLALDLDETAGGASPPHSNSYSIRVKRVLGDAHTFRDLCAKLLPQLKL